MPDSSYYQESGKNRNGRKLFDYHQVTLWPSQNAQPTRN
jgi:hypothetical protein